MTDAFERLRKAYAIEVGDRLLAGVGLNSLGAVAVVMPDATSAHAWIAEFEEDLIAGDQGSPKAIEVGDPWRFMRRAAGEGFAGIEGAKSEAFSDRFMFMVRVEEAGRILPTILGSITATGLDSCLSHSGVKPPEHAEVLHWQRFDLLDAVTERWGVKNPFRNWSQGDPLYELGADGTVLLFGDVSLLGDWNSLDGAFAFFTSREKAQDHLDHLHHDHLGNTMFLQEAGTTAAPGDQGAWKESLRPIPVPDLNARLRELTDWLPAYTWCVNPKGHREDSAYGTISASGLYRPQPTALREDPAGADPRMTAVSGIWRVLPGNSFQKEDVVSSWMGHDTIRWSGGQGLQLLPLDRSFALEPRRESYGSLTDSEVEEWVDQLLGSHQESGRIVRWYTGLTRRLDLFHLVAWNSVTGEGSDQSEAFEGLLDAVEFLSSYDREFDREVRKGGVGQPGLIGFTGSADDDFESLRSDRFRLGLHRISVRVVRNGYRPTDAADLVALCNGTLRTLHVDFAGYAKDLIWASSSEQQNELLDRLAIDESEWREWARSADAQVDAQGKALVLERMGEERWELLDAKVQHFLSTALLHLKLLGDAPQLDSAPISMEVVKALEVELVSLFDGWRGHLGEQSFQHDEEDSAESALAVFLATQKPPSLGAMSYLLRAPNDDASDLKKQLHSYLRGLPNGEFLTSNRFSKRDLQRVLNKYRNGGVHSEPISLDTCREAVDKLVGTPEKPGYIPEVARWRR